MKKENFFRWLQKYSSLILRAFFPEVVAYVNRLIEMRAREKVAEDATALAKVPAKITKFWAPTNVKCRAFWVLLVTIFVIAILMTALWNFRFISVLISAVVILKFVLKAIQPAKEKE